MQRPEGRCVCHPQPLPPHPMIIFLMTDMEGLAGIDHWDQCYHPDDASPVYQYGREQLTADVNAAVAGCFDAGATEVRVLDGHGRNQNRGFIPEKLDPRVTRVWIAQENPRRFEGLDASVTAVAIVGQHAMAGTLHAFLDHTQCPKEICRYLISGQEHGEMSQLALYAGSFHRPLIYASGDDALCAEAHRLFPHVLTTPTKHSRSWSTCDLYPPEVVRQNIRQDIARALTTSNRPPAWQPKPPYTIEIEFAWTELADRFADIPYVQRPHPRSIRWQIHDSKDIFTWPSPHWQPT
ncbi:MAG: M55 family metallopeptidase [Phycisphaeraceae bacterium]|nr:M55 family metallopeptidase [Phycisphaeraceae bacterium]